MLLDKAGPPLRKPLPLMPLSSLPPTQQLPPALYRYPVAVVAAAALTALFPWTASAQTNSPPFHAAAVRSSAAAAAASASLMTAKADDFLVREMRANPKTGWLSLIIRFDAPPTAAQKSALRQMGGDIYRDLPIVQSVAVRLPRRSVLQAAALPFVARLSTDTTVQKNDEFTVQSSGADTAFSQYSATGNGVAVAIVDSGVAYHPDLGEAGLFSQSRVVARKSFLSSDTSGDDKCGHGTHIAGIIAGNGFASSGPLFTHTFYGIARKAKVVSLRVLSADGSGSVSNVIAAIQWAVTNRAAYNVRVLNLSLGHPVGESYRTDPLCQAVEYAWKNGIVVVCAAGNTGRLTVSSLSGQDNGGYGKAYGSIQSPANDPCVITVGATKSVDGIRSHDEVASYSSRGPTRLDYVMKPDLVAPGNRVISLYTFGTSIFKYNALNGYGLPISSYTVLQTDTSSPSYFRMSGTSMAAPVVAGAAALLLEKNPSLTPDTVKARLMISADKRVLPDGKTDPFTYGAGFVNIPAALANTAIATHTAVSPNVTLQSDGSLWLNGSQIILTPGEGAWGTTIVNPTQVIWGGGGDVAPITSLVDSTLTLITTAPPPMMLSLWGNTSVWTESFSGVDLSYTVLFGEN